MNLGKKIHIFFQDLKNTSFNTCPVTMLKYIYIYLFDTSSLKTFYFGVTDSDFLDFLLSQNILLTIILISTSPTILLSGEGGGNG